MTRHQGTRLVRTMTIPVPDRQGRPQYILGLCEDITERKQLENEERHTKEMLAAVIDASPLAIFCLAADQTVLIWSRAAEEMFGYTRAEVVGQPYGLVPPGHEAEFDMLFQRALAGETIRDIEVRRRRKDGSLVEVSVSGAVMRDATGVRGVAYALTDVTQRKAVELQLRQSQKMEAVGNLTGGVAHDFNNLLGVVIGNLDLLRARDLDPESDGLAGEALDAALSGADLTKRLLAFARRQPLQPRQLDINGLVTSVSKLIKRILGDDIELRLDPEDGVWPVMADPGQLEASLINIVTNARDAMPNGGQLVIATRNRVLDEEYIAMHPGLAAGDYSLIEVSDSGHGMAFEVVQRIFEPFFTTKEPGKGTGLGLSMVFGFMKQSGGHINVYSEPGAGTTFRLYLPRAHTIAAMAEQPAEQLPVQGGKESILAVEDNANLRRVVERQLTDLGYRVHMAANGPAALDILQREHIDLLFTDVVMPGGLSGYELARAASGRWPALRVLLTSGFPEAKMRGENAAIDNLRLLSKPYRKDELARVVRALLEA